MAEQAFPKGVDQQHRYAPHCHPGDSGGRDESFGNDEEAYGMYLRVQVHPKFVQELLVHATIATTLDTYSHVMPSMGDATAKAMEDA